MMNYIRNKLLLLYLIILIQPQAIALSNSASVSVSGNIYSRCDVEAEDVNFGDVLQEDIGTAQAEKPLLLSLLSCQTGTMYLTLKPGGKDNINGQETLSTSIKGLGIIIKDEGDTILKLDTPQIIKPASQNVPLKAVLITDTVVPPVTGGKIDAQLSISLEIH